MPSLIKRARIIAAVLLFSIALCIAWVVWNIPASADMAAYVPADCLAFVEVNDVARLAEHISNTDAWKALAGPIGARPALLPSPWLVRLARWTGIGSSASVILSRSQIAVVFSDAQTNQTGNVLTVKPVAALIIETHTSYRRMRPAMEKAIGEFANRVIGPTIRHDKQYSGADGVEWSSVDGNRHLAMAFSGTAVIISNDELLLVRCVNVRKGSVPSLANDQQLAKLRDRVHAERASIAGFISKPGIKPLLQAWALAQPQASEESLMVARLFGDTFGNLIDGVAWSATLTDGATEDHCFVPLAAGVADQLSGNLKHDSKSDDNVLKFVPADTYSVSIYHLREADGFWRDLNATVSSHADALAAVASRPFLRGLVRPYGISDPDAFARAIGPQFATIKPDAVSRSILIAEAVDRGVLRSLAQKRLGSNSKSESVGDGELMLSSSDDWGAAFAGNYYFSGPAEAVRHCLQAAQSQSITSLDQFKRRQQLIDVSLPINITKFTDDHQAAISFIEMFSESERPTFSTNAESVDKAARKLPYAVSVTMLKENGFDWTSRSAFGLMGSLFVYLGPERAQ